VEIKGKKEEKGDTIQTPSPPPCFCRQEGGKEGRANQDEAGETPRLESQSGGEKGGPKISARPYPHGLEEVVTRSRKEMGKKTEKELRIASILIKLSTLRMDCLFGGEGKSSGGVKKGGEREGCRR